MESFSLSLIFLSSLPFLPFQLLPFVLSINILGKNLGKLQQNPHV